jgi:hypothetical protein
MDLAQPDYVEEMLKRFDMEKCNPAPTPMDTGRTYNKAMSLTAEDAKYMADKQYRSLACTLLYPSNITRPDIAYACNIAARHLQLATKDHWKLLKRITRYLKGTVDYGLCFKTESTEMDGQMRRGQTTRMTENLQERTCFLSASV